MRLGMNTGYGKFPKNHQRERRFFYKKLKKFAAIKIFWFRRTFYPGERHRFFVQAGMEQDGVEKKRLQSEGCVAIM